MAQRFIRVDVGGTKVSVAVLEGNRLSEPVLQPTELTDSDRLVEQLVSAIGDAGPADAVGIGVPSVIDFATGTARHSVNVPLQDVPLRRILTERLKMPVFVDNDATCAALAEAHDDDLHQIAALPARAQIEAEERRHGDGDGAADRGRRIDGPEVRRVAQPDQQAGHEQGGQDAQKAGDAKARQQQGHRVHRRPDEAQHGGIFLRRRQIERLRREQRPDQRIGEQQDAQKRQPDLGAENPRRQTFGRRGLANGGVGGGGHEQKGRRPVRAG